jgi:hypothetical protein
MNGVNILHVYDIRCMDSYYTELDIQLPIQCSVVWLFTSGNTNTDILVFQINCKHKPVAIGPLKMVVQRNILCRVQLEVHGALTDNFIGQSTIFK